MKFKLRGALGALVGDYELADRVSALILALLDLLRGVPPDHDNVFMRSVALHAEASVSVVGMRPQQLRQHQRGPRLE